jgi:hypothetical protein
MAQYERKFIETEEWWIRAGYGGCEPSNIWSGMIILNVDVDRSHGLFIMIILNDDW